jgi:hypothetical protein
MPTNPAVVAELNRRRSERVDAGKGYSDNKYLRDYDSFAKSGVGKDIASRPVVPTVIGDANIRDKVIPQLSTEANDTLVKYDTTKSQLGTRDEMKKQQDIENKQKDPLGGFLGENEDTSAPDPYTQKQLDLIDRLAKSSDSTTRLLAERQKANYERQRGQEIGVSNAEQGALRTGLGRLGSRYTPGAMGQVLAGAKRGSLDRLAEIDDNELNAIEQLRAAQESKDYEMVGQKLELLKGVREERMKTLEATQKAEADEKKALETERNKILQDLGTNMAPPDVIAAVAGADTVADAVTAAGEYLQKGEYAEYARAVRAAGATPVDPNTYYARKIYGEGMGQPGSDPFAGDVPFQATIETAAANAGTLKGQETAAAQLAGLAKSGDYPMLFTRMKSLARQGMTAQTKTDVEQAEQQISSLDNMSKVLKEYQAAGGDMDFLKGTSDDIARKIGTLATDPRFASIATQMTAAFQQYRQNMTGAAFGAKENAEYKKVVPTADKSFELNDAIIDGLKNYYKQNLNASYETQLGEGYTNLKDYVEQGLTPTGKMLIRNEDEAKSKIRSLGEADPEVKAKFENLIREQPGLSFTEALQVAGYNIATSNEVGVTDPKAGIVGGYDITSYATDPTHEKKVASIYKNTSHVNDAQSADAYIRSIVPNSPVTGAQVMAAANATGVSPGMILAIMQQDSTFGTAGKAVRTKNPGNVGNTDSGATKAFRDWQEGVMAVAQNLAKRKIS